LTMDLLISWSHFPPPRKRQNEKRQNDSQYTNSQSNSIDENEGFSPSIDIKVKSDIAVDHTGFWRLSFVVDVGAQPGIDTCR
jgi:hypothetical protein